MRVTWLRVLALLALSAAATGSFIAAGEANSMETVDIGSRLELFTDDHLIAEMEGVEIRLHSPWSGGKVLEFDRPWEGNTSWQLTVFKDGDLFRMYYMGRTDPTYARKAGLRQDEKLTPAHPNFLCYAESRDGIHWTRPNLGLYEFDGSTENNIVTDRPQGAPLLDTRPGVDPAMRFKAGGGVGINPRFGQTRERSVGLVLWVSPDGLQWKKWREDPLFVTSLPNAFDSVNVLFWSESEQQYVFYFRYMLQDVRTFARTTSKDLVDWTEPVPCTFNGNARPVDHLYTNAATPYFRAPHISLGFPKRFQPLRQIHDDAPRPGISETVFMSSRDGIDWNVWPEAFIRPGREERNWIHRTNSTAVGVVPIINDEMSIYVSRNYTYPSAYLERFILRTDGFTSIKAPYSGGEFVTKPFRFEGRDLVLNFSTSAVGSIRIEVQDQDGQPIPGFTLEESPVIFGDHIQRRIRWSRPGFLPTDPMRFDRLAERPIRLRFVMKDADIYSFRFK